MSLYGTIETSNRLFKSDTAFNELYPLHIQQLSTQHWTPLSIAKKAAKFLSMEKDASILDIGCGAGKFCLAAAYYYPHANYYGIEQRQWLLHWAEDAKKKMGVSNVHFLEGNFTQVDFKQFDHFYFFNAFYENLSGTEKIDQTIDYSSELYYYYARYLFRKLQQKPSGTKLATYHSLEDEIPPEYHVVAVDISGLLKFWIKL